MNASVLIVKILVGCMLFLSTHLYGQEKNFLRDFSEGSVIEGSVRRGRLQPDYILDTESDAFSEIWQVADRVRNDRALQLIQKVEILINSVRKVFAPHHRYNDPVYLELMREYREKDQAIPLSKYISCGAGVCRENALLLHLVLKRAGIPNFFVYAKVLVDYGGSAAVAEDHGFVVFEYDGERWIGDSYFKQFNGYSYDEFMQNINFPRVPVRRLFFAEERTEPRAIVSLNSYPQAIACRSAIGSVP